MNLVKLNSVGSVLDMEDNGVYPQLVGGLPDLNMGVDLDDCSDEWVSSLSYEDRIKMSVNGNPFQESSNVLDNSVRFSDELNLTSKM